MLMYDIVYQHMMSMVHTSVSSAHHAMHYDLHVHDDNDARKIAELPLGLYQNDHLNLSATVFQNCITLQDHEWEVRDTSTHPQVPNSCYKNCHL